MNNFIIRILILILVFYILDYYLGKNIEKWGIFKKVFRSIKRKVKKIAQNPCTKYLAESTLCEMNHRNNAIVNHPLKNCINRKAKPHLEECKRVNRRKYDQLVR